MSKVAFHNEQKKPVWLGGVRVPAGETRMVDSRFIPNDCAGAIVDKTPIKNLFDGLNVSKSIELIGDFDRDKLQAALLDEQANGKRKGVIDAINKGLLSVDNADQEQAEELEAFSAYWANMPLDEVQKHLDTPEMQAQDQAAFSDILRAIIGEE